LALAELEAEFEAAIRRARAEADPALPTLLRRYAQTGLAPDAVALGLWREVAATASQAVDLAAARLALGDPAGALAAAEADPAAVLERLEALFRLDRLDDLAAAARRVDAPAGSPTALAAAYWSRADA